MRSTALIALLMVSLLSWGQPAGAGDPEALELAGTNVLTSRGSAWVDVSLPTGVSLEVREQPFRRLGPNRSIKVHGKGPFVGFILYPESDIEDFPWVIGGRFDSCDEDYCSRPAFNYVTPSEGSTTLDGAREIGRFIDLPKGDYRLYVVGDGQIRLRLLLRGLQGTQQIHLDRKAAADIRHLPPRLGTESGDSLFAAGDSFETGDEGIFFANLFIQGEGIRDIRWGICAYNGPSAPPEELAYGPHCTNLVREGGLGAGLSGSMAELDRHSHRGYFLARFSTSYAPNHFPPNFTGQRGLGVWHLTTSPVIAAGGQGIYLSIAP